MIPPNLPIADKEWVLKKAEEALRAKNQFITDHAAPLSEGGPHDFYSNADYWWPNPDTPDGIPYLCRDGESNPGNFNLHKQALRECRTRAAHLAAAYRLTEDERYARTAAALLEGFFVSEETKMNPRLPYAQAVPGRDTGNAFGVIDFLHLAEVPYATRALGGSPHMTPALTCGLRQWFAEYLHWLKTDPFGIAEMNWGNNHTICWHVQAASFARFIGDAETLAFCRDAYQTVILPQQMAPDGSFPRELRRTKPYGYSIFTLDNLLILCHILSSHGESLWEFSLPDGRGARLGMEFLYPYLVDKSAWPCARDVEHFDAWPAAMAGFLFAGIHLGEEKYVRLWQSLDPDPQDPEIRRNMAVRQPLLWLCKSLEKRHKTQRWGYTMKKQPHKTVPFESTATDIVWNKTGVVFTLCGERQPPLKLRLTLAGENMWRLQSAVNGEFNDMGAAQTLAKDLGEPYDSARLPFETSQVEINLSPFSLTIGNARIDSVYSRDGNLAVHGALSKDEGLFGCGQQFNAANQRGKRVEIMAIDKWCGTDGNSYVPIPFIHSTDGYALFLNRYEHSVFDLGAAVSGAWELQLAGAPLDLYIFANADPARTLKSYSELTGFAPMPASWLFGIQVCRYWPDFSTAEGILEMAGEMERSGFPWDAVIAEGFPTYDLERNGELKAVAAHLHAMGKKIMLYEGCARVPEGQTGFRPEYLVSEPDGNTLLPETKSYNPADNPDPRRVRFLDVTNPEAMSWWYDTVWGRLVKEIGVDGCKIDFCEQFPDHMPLEFHDGRETEGAHHWYPTLYNALMYRYYQEHRPGGGMCFSRGGGIGAQRYPFLWAGDQLREWKFLRAQLTGILSSGLSGIPFMSYDMAGYRPTKNPTSNAEKRVFIRGAQMACFSSNMQTHGLVTRPYDFDEPIKDIYREYAKLHQALRPYLLEQAAVSCETGMPLMRHLWLYDPSDTNTWVIEDEYLLGCALLIAPVFEDTTRRDIYLPKGQWRGLFDGKIYEGGQTLKDFEAAFSRVPVFVLEGHGSETLDRVLEGAEGILGRLAPM